MSRFFFQARAQRPKPKEVIFKDEVREIEGPVVVPDQELPGKPEVKPEKGKKFFFFKKKKTKVNRGLYMSELCCEKTCLWSFRPGPTQTRLNNQRRWVEAENFGFRK